MDEYTYSVSSTAPLSVDGCTTDKRSSEPLRTATESVGEGLPATVESAGSAAASTAGAAAAVWVVKSGRASRPAVDSPSLVGGAERAVGGEAAPASAGGFPAVFFFERVDIVRRTGE